MASNFQISDDESSDTGGNSGAAGRWQRGNQGKITATDSGYSVLAATTTASCVLLVLITAMPATTITTTVPTKTASDAFEAAQGRTALWQFP